jgi:hypothetical protein
MLGAWRRVTASKHPSPRRYVEHPLTRPQLCGIRDSGCPFKEQGRYEELLIDLGGASRHLTRKWIGHARLPQKSGRT